MIRSVFSILLGMAVTFGLVIFMAFMVRQTAEIPEEEPTPPIELSMVEREDKIKTKPRVVPRKPPEPKKPPPPTRDIVQQKEKITNSMPDINLNALKTSLQGDGAYIGSVGAGANSDGEAMPIVRIEPRYPDKAAREGKEGYVTLSFTIMPDGSVGNIKVVDAKPRRVFDREARRALSKWKYKPKIVDGKAVSQPGLKVKLDFKLDS